MIKLGTKVRDSITGFEGIVTARAEYLYGCIRCEVAGCDKPGEALWFDEQRLVKGSKAKAGGFHTAPPSRNP